jgi:hypothetical protein
MCTGKNVLSVTLKDVNEIKANKSEFELGRTVVHFQGRYICSNSVVLSAMYVITYA